MNFNATLIGQIIAFAFFAWFCTKYIWPHIIKALDDRQAKIADGLAAAEKGQHELELAKKRSSEILRESKEKAQGSIDQAQKRHDEIVEAAKDVAREEGQRILATVKAEIEQERQQVKESLRAEVSVLAIAGAEQILMREVDKSVHNDILNKISAGL